MIWGCITSKGAGLWTNCTETLNAASYIFILSSCLKNTIKNYNLRKRKIYFQQDNAPVHKAKDTMEYLQKENYNLIEWPAHSPDLNPIENVWHHLKLKLAAYPDEAKGVHECLERIKKEWPKFTKDIIAPYYQSMPKRIQDVIKAKGGSTKY